MKYVVFGYQVCKRTWKKLIFRPIHIVFSFFQPIFWLTIFGFLFERHFDFIEGDYLSYLLPGVCAMTVIQSSSQSGILFIKDIQTSFFGRYSFTPVSKTVFLFFKILADYSRIVLQIFILFGIGSLMNIKHINLDFIAIIKVLLGAFMFTFFYASISCLIALKTKTSELLATFVNLFNLPIIFTSTALVPNKGLPPWLSSIAQYNPLSHLSDIFRSASIDLDFHPTYAGINSYLLLFLLMIVAFTWCSLYFRKIKYD